MATFPTADQIARAVVAAARLTGADPLAVFNPPILARNVASRMRWIAFAALAEVFPDAEQHALGRCVGIASVHNFKATRAGKWWREDWVDEVVGAIVAPEVDWPTCLPPSEEVESLAVAGAETSAPTPADPPRQVSLREVYRPPAKPRRSSCVLPVPGEPEPGRSALDQRLSERAP